MSTYLIPRDHMRAMLHLAADGDIRTYLNGALIEVQRDGQARIVATDGHLLGVMRFRACAEDETVGPLRIIIPRETLKSVAAKDPHTCTLTRVRTENDSAVTQHWMLQGTLFQPLDGHFPDYVRVMPRKITGRMSHFNVDLVHEFGKVAVTLGLKTRGMASVRIGHNAELELTPGGSRIHGAALVELQGVEDFAGVIMPLRADDTETPTAAPDWATTRIQVDEPACAAA